MSHLIERSFQGVNRLFVLAFEYNAQEQVIKDIIFSKCRNKELQCYDWKYFLDQPVKRNKITYDNIRKIATGRGDDYTTSCLLDYTYFRDIYRMIAIDLSKRQALNSNRKAIQEINFNASLKREGNTKIFFILEEAKETVLDFS